MTPLIKTFVVKKKNRKYFECTLGKHRAKLLINDVSQNLSINSAVQLHVEDASSHSKYGTELKFVPLAVLEERSEEDAEVLRNKEPGRKEAEKWLAYAEDDANNGMFRTNAIKKSLDLCPYHKHLLERLRLLKDLVEKNKAQHEAEKWLTYAEADAQQGEVCTNAISKALKICPQFDHLAERLAALKNTVYKDSEIDFINSIML